MTLVKVNNPVNNFEGLVNNLFSEFHAPLAKSFRNEWNAFPPVNIHQTGNSYTIDVVAPGFEKADFKLQLEGNQLSISANKAVQTTQQDEQTKSIRKEFQVKNFKRSFTLDDNIETSGITARYENGILLVTLPKKEAAAATTQQINVQ